MLWERSYIKEGKIVPVEVTVKLILAAMEQNPGKKFLIDGFPRSMDNKDGWFEVVGDRAEVAFCLFYDCPEEELEKRLLKRGETSGRDDDNIESIRKRFRTFRDTSMPVVEWFEARGQLRRVSSAQAVEEVWGATQRIFDAAGVARADGFKVCLAYLFRSLPSDFADPCRVCLSAQQINRYSMSEHLHIDEVIFSGGTPWGSGEMLRDIFRSCQARKDPGAVRGGMPLHSRSLSAAKHKRCSPVAQRHTSNHTSNSGNTRDKPARRSGLGWVRNHT